MKSGTRDLILYIAIGVGIVTVGTLWAFLMPERYWPHLTTTWFAFIFFTVLLGIFLARFYWTHRKIVKLWLLLGALMAIHTMAYAIFLSYVHQWPALWYLFTMPIEVMLFAVIVKMCLNILPSKFRRF